MRFNRRKLRPTGQLYDKYSPRLAILGFPCNQFGGQEPGTNEEIKKFAISKGVHFDMFAKIKVNGPDAHPLWKFLQNKLPGFMGNRIKWNFTKFLVDAEGKPVQRFSPQTDPIPEIEQAIERLLSQQEESEVVTN